MNYLVTYEPSETKMRLGNVNDGGYVIIDNYDYDCYLSCGISDNFTFDLDFIKYRPNVPGHAFDGTIEMPEQFPSEIKFNKMMIGPTNTSTTTNMHEYLDTYKNVFLKMDIEGSEWKWFLGMTSDQQKSLKQIVVEFHGLFDNKWQSTVEEKKQVLKNLSETHWLVHVHGNNNGPNNGVPWVIECTYIRKDATVNGLNKTPFPIALDSPNDLNKPEHVLTKWPFVHNVEL